jgi:methanogenic corrinoid protein MtbC1
VGDRIIVMQRLASISGDHFEMEDGSYLVVPRKGSEAEQLRQSLTDGDVSFTLSRRPDQRVGLMRPAVDEQIDEEVIRNAASIVAFCLRKRKLVFDDKQEKCFHIAFCIVPSPFHVSMSIKPAAKRYVQKRSLRPSARRGVARTLSDELNADIRDGRLKDALEKAKEVHSLQHAYRELVAKSMLQGFLELGKDVGDDERFYIPRLLVAHKCYRAVLDELSPYLSPDSLPAPGKRVAAASIWCDYGEGRDIVRQVLSATGHQVTDLGANMEPADIAQRVKKSVPDMLVITALVPISIRLATDLFTRMKTCRKAVKELVELLKEEGMWDRVEVILVGYAFNKRFARSVGVRTVCRDLWSLFLEFHKRAAEKGGE